jgi:hypothetical protein
MMIRVQNLNHGLRTERVMKSSRRMFAAVVLGTLAMASLPVQAADQDADKALHDWQVRRLTQPLPQELAKERSGSVYVYDGLTDREVDAALTGYFERIQYMMFVGTKKTDEQGKLKLDSATGQVMQESGGCGSSAE